MMIRECDYHDIKDIDDEEFNGIPIDEDEDDFDRDDFEIDSEDSDDDDHYIISDKDRAYEENHIEDLKAIKECYEEDNESGEYDKMIESIQNEIDGLKGFLD